MSKTINYCGEFIEVSNEVAEFLEGEEKHIEAQNRSDRRHLSKSIFETSLPPQNALCINGLENRVIHKIFIEKLSTAVATLDADEKKLIELYYYENLSMEQVGKHFGISRMAVSKRNKKLLAKLRERMESYAPFFYYKKAQKVITFLCLKLYVSNCFPEEQSFCNNLISCFVFFN